MTSSTDEPGGSVLIVDDNRANLKLLRSLLREHGFTVRVATNGGMALDSVRAEIPSLILLDVQMPHLSGYDVCASLKADEITSRIPVIFISAATELFDKVKAFEVGGVDYITKPFEPNEVLARVNSHMRLSRLQRELQDANEKLEQRVEERTARLRKSEERYRATFEQAPVGVAHLSLDREFLTVNPRLCTMLGYTREELLLKRPSDITHMDDRAATQDVIEQVLGGVDGLVLVQRYLRKDEGVVWSDTTVSVILDAGGEPEALVMIIRDITESRKAEEERGNLEAQLRHKQKMETIGTLAAGIAHDFNNVLVPILGFSQLARQQLAVDDPTRDHLQLVLESAHRAEGLVKQILTLSRVVEPERESVRWEVVVREALQLLRASVPTTIEIRTHIAEDLSPVFADPNQLHQVVMNLGANAAHAMRQEAGILEVSLEMFQPDDEFRRSHPDLGPGECVRLAVRDTGEGMDSATLERLFEPFFTTKAVGEGTGLGLSIVHGIVMHHGGAITVDSRVGQGTIFYVVLGATSGRAKEATTAVDAPSLGGDERILFVDDEPLIIALADEWLQHLGYHVSTTTSSEVALRWFRTKPDNYDLVITDQTMPVMTGTQLASKLVGIRDTVPVILVSGYHEPVPEEEAADGAIRWRLDKPFGIRDLAVTVRRVLDEDKEQRRS